MVHVQSSSGSVVNLTTRCSSRYLLRLVHCASAYPCQTAGPAGTQIVSAIRYFSDRKSLLTGDISSEVLREAVDIDEDTRLILCASKHINHHYDNIVWTYAGVNSRYRNQRPRTATATVDDIDLCAPNVELGATICARSMQGNLFVHASDIAK